MAYRLPQDGGGQYWRQQHAGFLETDEHIWNNERVPENTEALPQTDAVQMPSATHSSSWDSTYNAPGKGVAYSYESMSPQRNTNYSPVVLNSFLQVNANSLIGAPCYPETTVIPGAQYHNQAKHPSSELGDFCQQAEDHPSNGQFMSSIETRGSFQVTRGEPSRATPPSFSRRSSTLDLPFSSHDTPQAMMEYSVTCPYYCGTSLTGIHAVGNLTRHLKSRACPNSPRRAVDYPCPIYGCINKYARSDGLKVHMRKRHGAPPAEPRNGSPIRAEFEEE